MKFRLGCELAYKVVAETVFIFNVEVALLQRHSDLVDQLIFNPNVGRRSAALPAAVLSARKLRRWNQ